MIEMQDFRPIRSPSPAPDRESFSQKRDSKSGVKDNDKSAWIEQVCLWKTLSSTNNPKKFHLTVPGSAAGN